MNEGIPKVYECAGEGGTEWLVKVASQQTVAAAGKLLLEYWASSHHCLGWAAGTYHSLN